MGCKSALARLASLEAGPGSSTAPGDAKVIAIVEPRVLAREALAVALTAADLHLDCRAFGSIGEWEIDPDRAATAAVLVCLDGFQQDEGDIGHLIQQLVLLGPTVPVVAIGESEEPGYIARVLETGVRGYIPTNVGLAVVVQAIALAIAGGVFVPAIALRKIAEKGAEPRPFVGRLFGLTERQALVARAVSQGKPSKVIAYELGLSESTVKVHIRTIMKKLHARNRTEVAFKLYGVGGEGRSPR